MNSDASDRNVAAGALASKSVKQHWPWVNLSYFAEGLPWSLLHQVVAEFFTAIGSRPSQVGRTALLHLPILLKVMFSPVVARFFALRSWMVGTQAMMGVLMGGVAVTAHKLALSVNSAAASSPMLWVLLLSIGILSAVYDIACDGFYLENLDKNDQSRYSGTRVAAYRVAMLLGSFLLVFLGGLINWLFSFLLGAAFLLGLSVFLQFILPATPAQKRVTNDGSKLLSSAIDSYRSFISQESAWLVFAFLLFYKAADAMMFSMSSVLLKQHLGIGTELRASLGIFSTIASILGAVWGGTWIAQKGLKRAMFPITILMVATEPLFALMALSADQLQVFDAGDTRGLDGLVSVEVWSRLAIVTAVTVTEKLCAGLAVAAQTIFIMRRCHPMHKTAHYAFATVVYSLAQIVLGSLSGYLFEGIGPVGYYLIVSLVAIPTLFLVRMVPLDERTACGTVAETASPARIN